MLRTLLSTLLVASLISPVPGDPKVVISAWELSGADRVTGGLFVADDELVGSVLFVPADVVEKNTTPLAARLIKIDRGWKASEPNTPGVPNLLAVQDIEGIATDGKERVYLLGSHQPKDRKEKEWPAPRPIRRKDREFLLECKWDIEQGELRLRAVAPDFAALAVRSLAAAGIKVELTDTTLGSDFNAEGLAYNSAAKQLFVGLRSPVEKGKALVLAGAVDDFFKPQADTTLAVHQLDLGGAGVRSLHHDAVSGRILILAGAAGEEKTVPTLWAWEGTAAAAPRAVLKLEGQGYGPGTPEGICRDNAGNLVLTWDIDTGINATIQRLNITPAQLRGE